MMSSKWKNVSLLKTATMVDAIEAINAEGLRVALVVDEQFILVGIITDGDVRRALLAHKALTTPVTEIMNASPKTANVKSSKAQLLSLMKREQILSIPIVDQKGVLTNLETLHHVINVRRYDTPIFLMAGGFGTRLQPLTDACPKPLLKVGGKPILETILESFIAAGFYNFYISTHFLPDMIREYFGDGSKWDVTIQYIHEESPLGTGGALSLLPVDLPDAPIIMMNGDILTKVDFEHLLNYHNQQDAICTMCGTEYEFQVPYGVIESDGERVMGMVEKPLQKYFINAGIYVIEPKLIRQLVKNTRVDMPTLLEQQMAKGQEVAIFPLHEYWLDIGKMNDFERAQHDYERDF
jgi:dTDP-glucose pyrophosphorylase